MFLEKQRRRHTVCTAEESSDFIFFFLKPYLPHLRVFFYLIFLIDLLALGCGAFTFSLLKPTRTLTSFGDFLRCSFSYPAVGACDYEAPVAQVNIQVGRRKMLCCSFIAAPVKNQRTPLSVPLTSREEDAGLHLKSQYFYAAILLPVEQLDPVFKMDVL